jgi:hypothetical protein
MSNLKKLKFKKLSFAFLLFIGCSHFNSDTLVINDPDEIIMDYFKAIEHHDYKVIVQLYGGDYDIFIDFNPNVDPKDKEALIKSYLINQSIPLRLQDIHDKSIISKDEIIYKVSFLDTQNNKPFRNGIVLSFSVKKIDGMYRVMRKPPYLH